MQPAPTLSRALPDQHPRLADGAVPDAGPAGDAGRHSRRRAGPPGRAWGSTGSGSSACGGRGRPGSGSRASNPEWRREFEETLPDLREEDIAGSGFAITGYTVHPSLGRRRGAGPAARAPPEARPPAHARLRPESHRAGSPWVEDHPEYYVPGTEADLARAPQNYTWVKRQAGRPAPGPRPRPVLLRLAGHAPARLRQPGHAGGDDRRAAEDRRAVRRRALRHGHARPARRLRADLGPPGAAVLAAGDPARAGARAGLLLHGRGLLGPRMDDACSRGSTTPTTSGSTTACARGTRGRCASTSWPGSTTRTSSPASWRTTTSPGRRRRSRPASTRPRPSSRSCRRACGSSTRDSSRAGGSASRRTWSGRRVEPVDETLRRFYDGAPGGAPAADRARRPVAPARMRAGVGRQLDVGLLHRLRLAGPGRPARCWWP